MKGNNTFLINFKEMKNETLTTLVEKLTAEMAVQLPQPEKKMRATDFKTLLELVLADSIGVEADYYEVLKYIKTNYTEFIKFNGTNGNVTLLKVYHTEVIQQPQQKVEEQKPQEVSVVNCPIDDKTLRIFKSKVMSFGHNISKPRMIFTINDFGVKTNELKDIISFFKMESECQLKSVDNKGKFTIANWRKLARKIEDYLETQKTKQVVKPAEVIQKPEPPKITPLKEKIEKLSCNKLWEYLERFFNSLRNESGDISNKKGLSTWKDFFTNITPKEVIQKLGLGERFFVTSENKFSCGNQAAFKIFMERKKALTKQPTTAIVQKSVVVEQPVVIISTPLKEEKEEKSSKTSKQIFEEFLLERYKQQSQKIVSVETLAEEAKNSLRVRVTIRMNKEELLKKSTLELLSKYCESPGKTISLKGDTIETSFVCLCGLNQTETLIYETLKKH